MSFVEDKGGEAPVGNHLGLLLRDGEMLAIPQGAHMAIITDPTRADGVTPLVLFKVSPKRLVFRCACGKERCTRVLTFAASQTGYHPYGQ